MLVQTIAGHPKRRVREDVLKAPEDHPQFRRPQIQRHPAGEEPPVGQPIAAVAEMIHRIQGRAAAGARIDRIVHHHVESLVRQTCEVLAVHDDLPHAGVAVGTAVENQKARFGRTIEPGVQRIASRHQPREGERVKTDADFQTTVEQQRPTEPIGHPSQPQAASRQSQHVGRQHRAGRIDRVAEHGPQDACPDDFQDESRRARRQEKQHHCRAELVLVLFHSRLPSERPSRSARSEMPAVAPAGQSTRRSPTGGEKASSFPYPRVFSNNSRVLLTPLLVNAGSTILSSVFETISNMES